MLKKRKIDLQEVLDIIKDKDIGSFDAVIGIGREGIIPAGLIARHLELDISIMWLRQYSDSMPPRKLYDSPKLMKPFNTCVAGMRVLVVDDFSRNGNTLNFAKNLLLEKGAKSVKTLAIAGIAADLVLIKTEDCVSFNWQESNHHIS